MSQRIISCEKEVSHSEAMLKKEKERVGESIVYVKNHNNKINAIKVGDLPFQSFSVSFNGEISEGNTTPWKHASYDVWFRDAHMVLENQLKNPDFSNKIDVAPKIMWDERKYMDSMSGDCGWQQAVSALHHLLNLADHFYEE